MPTQTCLETLVIVCSDELLKQEAIYHTKQCYPNAPGKNSPYIFHKDFVQKKYTLYSYSQVGYHVSLYLLNTSVLWPHTKVLPMYGAGVVIQYHSEYTRLFWNGYNKDT